MSWTEKICTAKTEDEAQKVLLEAMNVIGKDLSGVLHRYEEIDAPLLISAMRATIPQLERIAGPTGRATAAELQRILVSVMVQPKE